MHCVINIILHCTTLHCGFKASTQACTIQDMNGMKNGSCSRVGLNVFQASRVSGRLIRMSLYPGQYPGLLFYTPSCPLHLLVVVWVPLSPVIMQESSGSPTIDSSSSSRRRNWHGSWRCNWNCAKRRKRSRSKGVDVKNVVVSFTISSSCGSNGK